MLIKLLRKAVISVDVLTAPVNEVILASVEHVDEIMESDDDMEEAIEPIEVCNAFTLLWTEVTVFLRLSICV